MEPNREIELKLEASPADLRRLPHHALVEQLARDRAVTTQLETVYFDTAESGLAGAGFALRIRHGGSRRVQALKGERAETGGLFERDEVESPIDGSQPDVDAIAEPTLRARVRSVVGDEPLVAVFRTEFRRTRLWLVDGASEWTLDADEGEIVAGDRREGICEVELELRAGEPARLFEFALRLQEHFGLTPGTRSKAERGYALARGEPPGARSSRRVRLAAEVRAEQALEAILAQCLGQITGNAPCATRGVDPEGVHQMRVGVRRLRVALSTFAPLLPAEPVEKLHGELRWLGGELGAARDLDVFDREILGALVSELGEDVAFERLARATAEWRGECAEAVREVLRSPRYARLVLELGSWIAARGWRSRSPEGASARLARPAREVAPALLERHRRKVERLGAGLTSSVGDRHRLRIQLKRLRYSSEFHRDLFPGSGAKGYLRRVAALQGALGTQNDLATAQRILESLLARLGAERGRAHDRVAGFVEGWAARLAVRELEAAGPLWKRLQGARPFWR